MQKRSILFGGYGTAYYGWTLTSWKLSPPEIKTHYIDRPGGDGSLDLSTALTDGEPRYEDRTLTATFELSTGDKASRDQAIRYMFRAIHGKRLDIELPDDMNYYMSGRVSVEKKYSDMAHASVTVSAVCEPWMYSYDDKIYTLTASNQLQIVTLTNTGDRTVVPEIKIQGDDASVFFGITGQSITLSAGLYKWPELIVPGHGTAVLKYTGSGEIQVGYKEAVLI